MKKFLIILIALLITVSGGYFLYKKQNDNSAKNTQGKVLVAYFSHSGNTEIIAKMIAQKTNADLFEIKTEQGHYPKDYDALIDFAGKERQQNIKPELVKKAENFDQYDTIFLGYPNWFNDMPMPVYSFLESHDLSNKKVYHFCTHGTGGPVKKDGFAIYGKTVREDKAKAEKQVTDWLDGLK